MAITNNMTGGWGGAPATPQLREPGGSPAARPQAPVVQLVGEVDHPDFRDAIQLLRSEARLVSGQGLPPELIVVAQSRPDAICRDQLKLLRRDAPLSGMVLLLGSWCEGETRTGRPWPGAQRLYWYEFLGWWQRQLVLRTAGRCPDWCRPADLELRISEPGRPRPRPGLVVVQSRRETADALTDALKRAGFAAAWQPPDRTQPLIRGALAGVWDGAQLNEREAASLAGFCTQLARDGAPVLALLDFPRRDRVDQALIIGAAAVIGKPWRNSDLIAMLETITAASQNAHAA